ncbi:hypothetical protein F2Q69_00023906 [Brassica cretica]|uniref:Uncharacterized protein n=1 Tax=Brassica cretica TaxID=69181 RepID=A0A8S9QD98_BRACR|nr:hypothetical protein F2Q69_00023906 [Brassica cretica]
MQPPFLPHHKSEAKLCREFPEAENPSRRALSPSILRRLSLFSLSPSHALSLSPSRRRREVVVVTRSQPS